MRPRSTGRISRRQSRACAGSAAAGPWPSSRRPRRRSGRCAGVRTRAETGREKVGHPASILRPTETRSANTTIRRVTSPAVPEPPPERWSNCLVSDGIAYVSGMTARGTGSEGAGRHGRVRAGLHADLRQDQRYGRRRAGAMADVVRVSRSTSPTSRTTTTGVGGVRREFFTGTLARAGRGRAGRARDPGRDRGYRPYRQGPVTVILSAAKDLMPVEAAMRSFAYASARGLPRAR